MDYKIATTTIFEKEFERLAKKYKSLPQDLANLREKLKKNPELGVQLGGHVRKIRMAISAKGKGKRGGARILTKTVLISVSEATLYLFFIYDKNELNSVSQKVINGLLQKSGLL